MKKRKKELANGAECPQIAPMQDTKTKQRRVEATRGEIASAVSTKAESDARGGARTFKVAVPESLNAATKAVAARRSKTVQDLVAERLREDREIAAEEAAYLGRVAA
jgi:hypothetical protein